MTQLADEEARSSRYTILFPSLLIGICLLYGWATLAIRPLYDLSRNQSIPISIGATKTADYSPDFYTPVGNVSLNILLDLFRDLDPASVPEDRMATLVGSLQTPVEWVTMPADSTQIHSTIAATLHVETTIPETALTEDPVVIVPATPIPSIPLPPPPPKPTKPPIEEPPPPTPTATYTPSPEPVHLEIIIPASDGTEILNLSNTAFEAEAWDPAVGTSNGDGITSISFMISNSLGPIIYTYADSASDYCVFKGDGPCKDAEKASISLKAGNYTLEATVLTATGETKTVTRTFIVPVITHLEIIIPPSNGTIIENINETKFEAKAWDSTVGLRNGDGITSVEFFIYDSRSTQIYTGTDSIPAFCSFGGDSVCNPVSASPIILSADNYTLKAIVLTNMSETKSVLRTFTIR